MLRVIVYASLPQTGSTLTMDALPQRKPLTRQAESTVQLWAKRKGGKVPRLNPLEGFETLKCYHGHRSR
jgi:hypothetical protein